LLNGVVEVVQEVLMNVDVIQEVVLTDVVQIVVQELVMNDVVEVVQELVLRRDPGDVC
jgi:hypothetical protein